MLNHVVKPCHQDKPFYFANYNVISLLNSPVGRILQRWRCSCLSSLCIRFVKKQFFSVANNGEMMGGGILDYTPSGP